MIYKLWKVIQKGCRLSAKKLALFVMVVWMLFGLPQSRDCIAFWKRYSKMTCYNHLIKDVGEGRCWKNRDTQEVIMVAFAGGYFTHVCNIDQKRPDAEALKCGTESAILTKLELVECDLSGFDIMKYTLDKTISTLVINDKQYRDIKLYIDIPFLENITFLYTSSGEIIDIRFGGNSSSVRAFNMHHFRVKGFLPSPFANLSNLRTLRLTYGTLDSLGKNFFDGLGVLEELDLTGNKITIIPSKTFSNLSSVNTLILESNDIERLPEDLFGDLYHLEVLNLKNNAQLDRIPKEYFRNAGRLAVLIISNCSLRFIRNTSFPDSHTGGRSLIVLNLSHNKLITIQEGAFRGLHYLRKLDVSHNPIAVLHLKEYFGPKTSLAEIVANNCNLTEMPTLDLQVNRLLRVDLSFNKISYVKLQTSSIIYTDVFLNDNDIAVIEISVAGEFGRVPKYVLRNNKPRCSCHTKTFLKFIQATGGKIFSDIDSIICRGTDDVKVTSVDPTSLKCPSYCPLDCYCNGSVVQCKGLRLRSPPFPLPSTTNVLYLDNNDIDSLNTIDPNYWKNITHLYASNNSLKSLSDWNIPPSLIEMSVDGNRLKAIPPSLMEKVEEIAGLQISLANNEWKCDCGFVDTKDWFSRNKLKIRDANVTFCVLPSTDVGVISDISVGCFCGSPADVFLIILIVVVILLVLVDFCNYHRTGMILYFRRKCVLHPIFADNPPHTGRIHPVEIR